jgi:nucleotide-binding universal stress UspA family protein
MARANKYGITLLEVAPGPVYSSAVSSAFAPSATVFEGWAEEVNAEAKYLAGVAACLRKQDLDVEVKLLEDDPALALVSYATHHPEIALIVMSTHGRSGLGRWIFGSVAEKVLHASPVPLLLIRPRETALPFETVSVPVYKSIVVPLDGSTLAAQALEPAEVITNEFDATLTLVSAVPEMSIYGEIVAPPALPIEWEDESVQMSAYLDKTSRRLKAEGYPVNTRLEYGPPAEVILHAAEKVHAQLIVMATHGRTGLPRLWLGSVAMKVVQASCRPVLLVRAKQTGIQPETPTSSKEKVAV